MTRVALDAMGGDYAPEQVVRSFRKILPSTAKKKCVPMNRTKKRKLMKRQMLLKMQKMTRILRRNRSTVRKS